MAVDWLAETLTAACAHWLTGTVGQLAAAPRKKKKSSIIGAPAPAGEAHGGSTISFLSSHKPFSTQCH